MVNPDALAKVRDVAQLTGLLPYLEAEVSAMERAVEARVYQLINNGKLDESTAWAAWQEKAVLRRLLQRFRGRIEGGKSVGTSLGAQIDLEKL